MLSESRTERFYCKDEIGKDLFYIELVFDDEMQWAYMNSSLDYDFKENKLIEELHRRITDYNLNPSFREKWIEELFSVIRSLPGIEKYYFAPAFLDKTGRHVPEYSAVLKNIIQHKNFPDYTVFSPNENSYYFEYSLSFLVTKLAENDSKKIDKILFEKLIKNDITLITEYVEWMSNNSEFFHVFLGDENTQYDCFIMMQEKEIKLFFVREVISS